jgi:hypothetical protein
MAAPPTWRASLEEQLARCDRGDPAWREAAGHVRAELRAALCECLSPEADRWGFDRRELGSDQDDADLAIDTCRLCGRVWIHYFYEDHIHDTSGRWFRGVIDAERAAGLDAEAARDILHRLPWKLCGGTYYMGRYVTAGGLRRP